MLGERRARPSRVGSRTTSAVNAVGRRCRRRRARRPRSASYTPGLGRLDTRRLDSIDGGHFAERCQAFVLIALGESIVVTGATLAGMESPGAAGVLALVVAFTGSVLLWWVYFDRSASEGARVIAASSDPGRLGRSAYHFIHPVMVAGIIVAAAADAEVLSAPDHPAVTATAGMVLGGTALFLAGHALFKVTVWRITPWARLIAIPVLALLGPVAPHVPAWALSACSAAVLLGVVVSDRLLPHVALARPRHAVAGASQDRASDRS